MKTRLAIILTACAHLTMCATIDYETLDGRRITISLGKQPVRADK